MRLSGHGLLVAIPATVDLPPGLAGEKQATFLHSLSLRTAFTPEARRGRFVNFHHNDLKRLAGRDYRSAIDCLKEAGVIDENSRYSTGTETTKPFTKSFRLTLQHRHGRAQLYPIESAWGARRARKIYAINKKNLGSAGMHYRILFDEFRLDTERANSDKKLYRHWDKWTIARWANREEFAKRCDYRRYHSLTTQLPRIARQYLSTRHDESLSIVDVSACQPVLLAHPITTRPRRPNNTGHTTRLLPYAAQFYKATAARDVRHWVELSESRAIYDFMYEAVQSLPGPAITTITLKCGRRLRNDLKTKSLSSFKRATIIPLFDRVETMLSNPIYRVMQQCFPTVAAYVLDVKREKHQTLACLLQLAEAELMIDRVGNVLLREFPNEPVQPIHDALLVRLQFAETAISIIKEQFATIGLHPHVKCEQIAISSLTRT